MKAAAADQKFLPRRHRQRLCKKCGEPELTGAAGGGDFGWFTVEEDGKFKTFCNRCGQNPLTRKRKP